MFNIQHTAPTLEMIVAKRKRTKLQALAVFLISCVPMACYSQFMGPTAPRFIVLGLIFSFLLVLAGVLAAMFKWDTLSTYQPVEQSKCEDILAVRASTPAAARYYQEILDQCRQFHYGDLRVLQQEATSEQHDKDYRALYRLPEPIAA
jgi:hypothetical protein